MRFRTAVKVASLGILVLLGLTACAPQSTFSRSDPPPPPPSKPLPISAFAVKFTPAGSLTYPPTDATGIKTYKVVLYLFDDPPKVRRDEKPTRPYVMIGKLHFGKNWYTSQNLAELEKKHVPQVGGDAVLTWSNHQRGAAVIPGVGTFSYAAHELEVIRYTDK
jgi:hypothetical protein